MQFLSAFFLDFLFADRRFAAPDFSFDGAFLLFCNIQSLFVSSTGVTLLMIVLFLVLVCCCFGLLFGFADSFLHVCFRTACDNSISLRRFRILSVVRTES